MPTSLSIGAAPTPMGHPAGRGDRAEPWLNPEVTRVKQLACRSGRDGRHTHMLCRATYASVTLSLPGLGGDSVLLGAAEIAFEPLFVDPVAALGAALVDVRSRLAG